MRIRIQILIGILSSSLLFAGKSLPLRQDLWSKQSFLKSFYTSYGVKTAIEPVVSKDERALMRQFEELMSKGDRKKAAEILQSDSKLPNSSILQFLLGNISFELGQWRRAEQAYKKSLKIHPSFRRALRNLATVSIRTEKYAEARDYLSKAISLGDKEAATHGLLGYCLLEQGQPSLALHAYQTATILQAGVQDWKWGIVQSLDQLNRVAEALINLNKIVGWETKKEYVLLKVHLLLKVNQSEEAIVLLEWLRRKESLTDSESLLLAQLCLNEGIDSIALQVIQTVKVTQKTGVKYYRFLEEMLEREQPIFVEKLLEVIPKQAKKLKSVKRISSLLQLEKNKKEAEKGVLSLLENNPLDGFSLWSLANYYQRQSKFYKALSYYERASQRERYRYRSLLAAGNVCVKIERCSQALQYLEKSYEIKPSEELSDYIESVKKL